MCPAFDGVTEQSVAAKRPPPAPRSWRPLKLAGLVGLVSVAGYAVLAQQIVFSTGSAVVSAYTVPIRTPIDGYLSDPGRRFGTLVRENEVVARISNPTIDDRRLQDLRQRVSQDRTTRDSLASQRRAMLELQDRFARRADAQMQSAALWLAQQQQEAAWLYASHDAQRRYAERETARKQALEQSGILSHDEVDHWKSSADAAGHEAQAQLARFRSLRERVIAVSQGILLDAGGNDVAYSTQRADEIRIRVAEIDRQLADAAADLSATTQSLGAEQARLDHLTHAEMTAPISGMVWRLDAFNGERLTGGDAVMRLVSCRSAFLLAAVPQAEVPAIAVGGVVRFRLAGESRQRIGHVLSVTGDSVVGDSALAALPVMGRDPVAMMRISLADDGEAGCPVGRTARLLVPTGVGFLLSWLHL